MGFMGKDAAAGGIHRKGSSTVVGNIHRKGSSMWWEGFDRSGFDQELRSDALTVGRPDGTGGSSLARPNHSPSTVGRAED